MYNKFTFLFMCMVALFCNRSSCVTSCRNYSFSSCRNTGSETYACSHIFFWILYTRMVTVLEDKICLRVTHRSQFSPEKQIKFSDSIKLDELSKLHDEIQIFIFDDLNISCLWRAFIKWQLATHYSN